MNCLRADYFCDRNKAQCKFRDSEDKVLTVNSAFRECAG
jgi:hypothetical protein